MRYVLKKLQKNAVLVRIGIRGALTHIAVIQKHLFQQKFKPKYA